MVGVGAKTVIASRLALEAKRLLAHTEMAISAIAQRLGFARRGMLPAVRVLIDYLAEHPPEERDLLDA
jgi:AraC-like DNA-binding protein